MSTRTLTTTLPSDTLYVSGTVNGVATTWTNTEGQTWETVAERSNTDVYVVALTIINTVGAATETEFTLYYGLHLVTDRVQSDVDYVRALAAKIRLGTATSGELAEWNAAELRGCYNHTDLNRVGAAMQYVADRFVSFGYDVKITPKVDWMEGGVPTTPDLDLYLANLSSLRSVIAVMQTTPSVPAGMDRLTYVEANNIEKILEDIDLLLTNSAQVWYYSGDVFSGEV